MQTLDAKNLAPLLNGYKISAGPPRTITLPNASQLIALQDVTVKGLLLKKQLVTLDKTTNKRTAKISGNGNYQANTDDGDVHFCLGTKQGLPHIACELQNGKAFAAEFNQALGQTIAVSGFFRCLFEHPGFRSNDDAHIFELHPVKAVTIGGHAQTFDVDIPDQESLHTWNKPRNLSLQDNKIKVRYDKAKDTLVFTDMDGSDENYVRVSGAVSGAQLNASSVTPARFTFTSAAIGHAVQVFCLQGTRAARQLRQLHKKNISLVGLRNIDLAAAKKNQYLINLLAIDIR